MERMALNHSEDRLPAVLVGLLYAGSVAAGLLIAGIVVLVGATNGGWPPAVYAVILGMLMGGGLSFGHLAIVPVARSERAYDQQRRRELTVETERRRARYGSVEREHRAPHSKPIRIEGPPQFISDVESVLAELQSWQSQRYREAVAAFSQVVYDPTRLRGEAWARSDGVFGIHSGIVGADAFRAVFLHEVGHTVAIRQRGDHSEEAAEAYAASVLAELDEPLAWGARRH